MEDIILVKYMKDKGDKNSQSNNKSDKYSVFFDSFKDVTKDMNQLEKNNFVDRLKEYDNKHMEHFNETYAKYIVSDMYHFDNGKKYIGEIFSMEKAIEVCESYIGSIPQTVTPADIYVAINVQYHDYCKLFKEWFNDNIEYKIIESAILFWFQDDDYNKGFKLWNYFNKD